MSPLRYLGTRLSSFLNGLLRWFTGAELRETTSGMLGRAMRGDFGTARKLALFPLYVAVNLAFSAFEWRWWGHCERSIGRLQAAERPW